METINKKKNMHACKIVVIVDIIYWFLIDSKKKMIETHTHTVMMHDIIILCM